MPASIPWAQKYFVISLPRTGTRSTDQFFRERGFSTVHWPTVVGGVDYQSAVAGHEDSTSFVSDLLAPVIADHQVFSDVPFPVLYRELAVRYPSAKFILAYRNAFDWVRSLRRHHAKNERSLTPFERVLYWTYFRQQPERLDDLSERDLLMMHAQHMAQAIDFFADGSGRLGLFNLDADDSGAQIAGFANLAGPRRLSNIGRRVDKRLKQQVRGWWSAGRTTAGSAGNN